ncbi:hypothetical protein RAS1_32780 [Phycisphaerae bacterium RAS1]|nr:hypothetical protein RAS1_32780 [Phycisphaerae bacterium RAS1]
MKKRSIRSEPRVVAFFELAYPPLGLAVVAALRIGLPASGLVSAWLALTLVAAGIMGYCAYRVEQKGPLYTLLIVVTLANAVCGAIHAIAASRAPMALWAAIGAGLATMAACQASIELGGWLMGFCREFWRPGQCQRCGYDLRGSAGQRCPECGAERLIS